MGVKARFDLAVTPCFVLTVRCELPLEKLNVSFLELHNLLRTEEANFPALKGDVLLVSDGSSSRKRI